MVDRGRGSLLVILAVIAVATRGFGLANSADRPSKELAAQDRCESDVLKRLASPSTAKLSNVEVASTVLDPDSKDLFSLLDDPLKGVDHSRITVLNVSGVVDVNGDAFGATIHDPFSCRCLLHRRQPGQHPRSFRPRPLVPRHIAESGLLSLVLAALRLRRNGRLFRPIPRSSSHPCAPANQRQKVVSLLMVVVTVSVVCRIRCGRRGFDRSWCRRWADQLRQAAPDDRGGHRHVRCSGCDVRVLPRPAHGGRAADPKPLRQLRRQRSLCRRRGARSRWQRPISALLGGLGTTPSQLP